MSFSILISGGSSAWTLEDWHSFFSHHEIQPEEIIPNIFAWGSVNCNIIPIWAPAPPIKCTVYLTSQTDTVKLLRLNGCVYKDRTLQFRRFDAPQPHKQYGDQFLEDIDAIPDVHHGSDIDVDAEEATNDDILADTPMTMDRLIDTEETTKDAATTIPIRSKPVAVSNSISVPMHPKQVSFTMDLESGVGHESPSHSLPSNNGTSSGVMSNGHGLHRINPKLDTVRSGKIISATPTPAGSLTNDHMTLKHGSVSSPDLMAQKKRRSFTTGNHLRMDLLEKFKSADVDINYNSYINSNFYLTPRSSSGRSSGDKRRSESKFKRRETYATGLTGFLYKNIASSPHGDSHYDDDKRKRLMNSKQFQTSPNIRTRFSSNNAYSKLTASRSQGAERLSKRTREALLYHDRDQSHDLDESDDAADDGNIDAVVEVQHPRAANAFYGDGHLMEEEEDLPADSEEEEEEAKYEPNLTATSFQRMKESIENKATNKGSSHRRVQSKDLEKKHKRLHSRQGTRTFLDGIGGSLLDVAAGGTNVTVTMSTVNKTRTVRSGGRAVTPPPILTEETPGTTTTTPMIRGHISTHSQMGKYGDTLDPTHFVPPLSMRRRRSSLPENIMGNKRFTVNDPNSNVE